MLSKWWSHLTAEKDVRNFQEGLRNSKFVLDRLDKICYNMIEEARNSRKIDYDCPSWAYKQADLLGYARALQEIQKFLQIDPKENS